MEATERAYFAGIIDGEGCVSLASRSDKPTRYLTPTIQVANTYWPLLALLLKTFGGNIDWDREKRPNRKPCHCWRVAGNKARLVLIEVLPYLVVKKAQAELALSVSPQKRGYKLTEGMLRDRGAALLQMRSLNQRGTGQRVTGNADR